MCTCKLHLIIDLLPSVYWLAYSCTFDYWLALLDGLEPEEAVRFLRTFDGDMSTFLGFTCARSSPKLGGTLRCSSARTTSGELSKALLPKTLLRSRRWFSFLSIRDTKTSPTPLASPVIRWQWCQPSAFGQQKRTLLGFKPQMVITEYVHLPKTYKDEEGLPFRDKEELSISETAKIFPGFRISPGHANKLLRILHGRRVAGTLEDPSLAENTAMFSQSEINAALTYLRKTVPVDEILNAGLRAEEELRQLDLDPDQAETTDQDGKAPEEKPDDNPRSIYGESILDRIRAANIARREAEERAEEEQRRREEEQAAQNWGGLTQYDPTLHRGLHPQQLEAYNAATSNLAAPPDVPRSRILLPTTVFFVAVLGGLYLLVSQVAPPRPGVELLGGYKEKWVVAGSMAMLNLLVFIAWKRVRLWKFLNQHFILDFVTPRPHQILTAMFTHQNYKALLMNTSLLFVGASLFVDEVGTIPFLATFLASGMCSFIKTMYLYVWRGELIYVMGGSSASLGVVCAYFWLYRFDGFKILGLPPDPLQGIQGLGIIGLFMVSYALGPMARTWAKGTTTDYSGHLVGMLTGIGCSALMENRWKLAKEEKMLKEAEAQEKATRPVAVEMQDQKKG